MRTRSGRIATIALGVIALVVGLVWVGQGANLIQGSSMTGSQMWFTIGIVVAIVGGALLLTGLRRGGDRRR